MKMIITHDFRDVQDQYLREEITISRAAEILNERANARLAKEIKGRFQEMVRHLTDPDNVKIYRKNNWTTKQLSDAMLNNYIGISPDKNEGGSND